MATITTTSNTTPLNYPGDTRIARYHGPSGGGPRLIALVKGSTADNFLFYKSTDDGASWSLMRTIVRTSLADLGAIWIDPFEWLFWAYRTNEGNQDRIYFRRMSSRDGGTDPGECVIGAAGNGGVAGTVLTGLDLVSFYAWNNWHYIPVACGTQLGSAQGVTMFCGSIDTFGALSTTPFRFSGTTQWLYSAPATGRVGVSIDKEHDGDGYAGTNANIWVSFGRDRVNQIKIPWSGDGWTGSTSQATIVSGTASNTVVGRWDGNEWLMCCPDPVNTSGVILAERNRANSLTALRYSPTHPTGVVRQATLAYNATTRDVRVFAVGTSTALIYYVDYIRATDTWTTWATTGQTVTAGSVDNFGVKRSSYGIAAYGLYVATGTTPYTLTYTAQSLSFAPSAPVWVPPPLSGAAANVALTLPLAWAFSDPDPGDTQSAYAVSKQVGAGALAYWRASDSTWQAGEVQNTSGSTLLTLATAWAAASDAAHTFKVKVWDSASVPSVYSAGLVVIPSTPVNPAITAPTVAQVLVNNSVTITWTAAEQTQFRVQLQVAAGATVYDSGWVNDSVSRSFLVPYVLLNSTSWTLHLQTANNEGLASSDQTRAFSIAYITPMVATTVATPSTANGWISVAITNPTPSGGAPAVASQELWRRITGSGDPIGVRVAAGLSSGATYQDWQAVGGVAYDYRAVVLGINGTTSTGVFTA
jgi:hypothetical protein